MIPSIEIPLDRLELTPANVAELFWSWESDKQSQFFNRLASCVLATPSPYTRKVGTFYSFDWQMTDVVKHALPHGLRIMEMIGESTCGQRLQAYKLANEPDMELGIYG